MFPCDIFLSTFKRSILKQELSWKGISIHSLDGCLLCKTVLNHIIHLTCMVKIYSLLWLARITSQHFQSTIMIWFRQILQWKIRLLTTVRVTWESYTAFLIVIKYVKHFHESKTGDLVSSGISEFMNRPFILVKLKAKVGDIYIFSLFWCFI